MYDILIIGAGVSSLFTLLKINSDKKILVLEAGPSLKERIQSRSMGGFGGLGISEGKYNFSPFFGSDLHKKIGLTQVEQHLNELECLLNDFGAKNIKKYSINRESNLKKKSKINFLECSTKHLGTKCSIEVFMNIYKRLLSRVEFVFKETVINVKKMEKSFLIETFSKKSFRAKKVVIAVGSHGPIEVKRICPDIEVSKKRRIDIGVRIEMRKDTLDSILDGKKEVKMRMGELYSYCMNKSGRIVKKKIDGYVHPEGQDCKETNPTNNLNFTLFQPFYFDSEIEMRSHISSIFNNVNGKSGRILGFPLHILSPKFVPNKKITGTLKFETVMINEIINSKLIKDTLTFINELEKLLEEKIDGNTLLYCYDLKKFGNMVSTNKFFETNIKGLYAIGDCSGVTYSLSHSAINGLYLGNILK